MEAYGNRYAMSGTRSFICFFHAGIGEKRWTKVPSTLIYLIAWFLLVSCQDNDCQPATRPKILDAHGGQYKALRTPNFTNGIYPPNQDCHWIIRSSGPDAWIQLNIHYSKLEDRLFTECDDYIEIRDGATNQSPLLLKWCGSFNPSAFSSSNDALYIRFKSDQFFQDGRGVNMSYIAYSRPGCPPGWREVATSGDCYLLASPKPPLLKMSWVDAQKRCSYERGNLLTVSSYDEHVQVVSMFGMYGEKPWVGVTDAQEEGKFLSIDPNVKLYPDPFRTASNDENRDCVYMDLKNGGPMYDVDNCRTERSYICHRKKDGTTVPYPPLESIIKQSLIAAASVTWNLAYLWLIIIVVLILLLLIFIPLGRKKWKEYKHNQINAQSETTSRNILIRNNITSENANTNSNNGTGPINGQHMPPPSNLILPYDSVNSYQLAPEKKPVESAAVQTMAETSTRGDSGSLTFRKISHGNGHLYSANEINGLVQHDGELGSGHKRSRALTVAPVEKFDRPVIRALDNVSAISLDEYWRKIEVERIRKIDVRQSPPAEL